MKLKVFLVACIVLLVFQSTNALRIVVANNWNDVVSTRLGVRVWSSINFFPVILEPQEAGGFDFDDTTDSIISIYMGYGRYMWKLLQTDLEAYNIPITGNHTITISMENGYGRWGVVVDGGEKIYIDATLVSRYQPGIPASGAA